MPDAPKETKVNKELLLAKVFGSFFIFAAQLLGTLLHTQYIRVLRRDQTSQSFEVGVSSCEA